MLVKFESSAIKAENKALRENIIKRYKYNGIIQIKMTELNETQFTSTTCAMTSAGYILSASDIE
jgi:hypothetical protein